MHPFDGMKALYHVRYWEQMEHGRIPPPVLVTLDPITRCNLKCHWCNARVPMRKRAEYSSNTIAAIPSMLQNWGVRAVCVAGGGEPLLHPEFSRLVFGLIDCGIQVGVVTNGTLIRDHLEALSLCKWVGISVDAGNAQDYRDNKGADVFDSVCHGIGMVAATGVETTWKYLIHPNNMHGLYSAATKARELHCRYFHARPAGVTWDQISKKQRTLFTPGEVRQAVHMLDACAELAGPGFDVVNTPDKFAPINWAIHHGFETCRAVGMTCVIEANGEVGLCCDRRGDPKLKLMDFAAVEDIPRYWDSKRHWDLMSAVDLNDCPRCTYAPHNRLYERFINDAEVCKWFI